jgi:hypothetical protein
MSQVADLLHYIGAAPLVHLFMSDLSISGTPVFNHAYVLISSLWVKHDVDALLSVYVLGLLREDILNQMFRRDYMRFSNRYDGVCLFDA